MTSEESRAVSFVAVLLCLAFAARVTTKPRPISISAAPADIAALRASTESMIQQPRATSSKRSRRRPATTTMAPAPAAQPKRWTVPEWRHPRPLQQLDMAAPALPPADRKVELNRATESQLVALPGVGPAMAKRIIARRDSVGRFSKIEELDAVRGIGPALIGRLRPLVEIR